MTAADQGAPARSTVLLLGTLDTKGAEYAYVRDRLTASGVATLVVDAGTGEPQAITPDISREDVARAAGTTSQALADAGDRGAEHLVVMDVTLIAGGGHDFHRHPGQEEMIIVRRGRITQYIEQECAQLGSGDSVLLEAGVVHASFNDESEPAELQVVIAPSIGGETGYGIEDVSGEAPWNGLRSS